ncbi:MAG: hypothetical protein AAF611_22960 [Bacteroidota bacterium]
MKKKSFALQLNKTKIVNLTIASKLYGGTDGFTEESDTNNPLASSGDCPSGYTCTNDKTNTNNTVPTLTENDPPPPTFSCANC